MGVHFKYAFIPGPVEPGEHKKVYIDLGTRDVMITGVHMYGPIIPEATEGETMIYLDCEPPKNISGFAVPAEIPNINVLVAKGDGSNDYGRVEAQHFVSANENGEVWGQENFPFYATGRLVLNYINKTDATVPEDRAAAVSIIYKDV